MIADKVIWPEPILNKLYSFRSEHFTPEESLDYIVQFILEVEELMLNPIMGMFYTEEYGDFKEYSRIIVKNFRVYYKLVSNNIVVAAIRFPRES